VQILEGDVIQTIRDNISYVAHEFRPTRDPLTSLREAAAICDL